MLNDYSTIKCSCCGRRVASTAYVCPDCGRDVRALKNSGCSCGNCIVGSQCDKGYGPEDGYPCLAWEEEGKR